MHREEHDASGTSSLLEAVADQEEGSDTRCDTSLEGAYALWEFLDVLKDTDRQLRCLSLRNQGELRE